MAKYDKSMTYISSTQTLIGEQKKHYLDMDTGEDIWCNQVTKRVYGTKNFWKCYLMDFLCILGIIDSKQLDVFIYIVENTNQATNIFLGTYTKITKDTGTCRQTVAKIMKKLQEYNFIKKIQNGAWFVNPDILMKGNDNKRQILLSYYEMDEPIEGISYSKTRQKVIANEEYIEKAKQLKESNQ